MKKINKNFCEKFRFVKAQLGCSLKYLSFLSVSERDSYALCTATFNFFIVFRVFLIVGFFIHLSVNIFKKFPIISKYEITIIHSNYSLPSSYSTLLFCGSKIPKIFFLWNPKQTILFPVITSSFFFPKIGIF